MATNKERIEQLEQGFRILQVNMQRMEMGMADKFQQLKVTMARLSDMLLLSNRDIPSHHNFSHEGSSRNHKEGGDYNKPFSSKIEKLEFPKLLEPTQINGST